MDELLMGIQSTVKASMAESATMSILHSAMIKAHEKVRSKDGVIERLNEQSKFCELAIMQLEACLKLVQEEAGNYILENKYDRLLPDLTQIKNRLYGRLRETEIALHDKDKELLERAENESRLKQALQAKEKELQSLRKSCQENHEKKEGDFCELKNSVDQQVLSIKQHLEGEKIALTRRMSQGSSVLGILEETEETEVSPVKGNGSNCKNDNSNLEMGFDQMGLEIDRLKQTVDTAFGMMQSTISGSDVHPLELQWMRAIENDIQSIMLKEIFVDLNKKFNGNVSFGFLDMEQWSELINEVTLLRNELEGLICFDDDRRKGGKFEELVIKDEELKKQKDEDSEEGSPLVTRMIETHEKLIRKKSEELNWVKAMEMLREKGPLSPRRSKLIVDSLKKSAEKAIKRVDDFLKWKARLDTLPNRNEMISHEKLPTAYKEDVDKVKDEGKTNENDDDNAAKIIIQQIEDSRFQISIIEGIYTCFFKSLTKDFGLKLDEYDMRNSKKEAVFQLVLKDMIAISSKTVVLQVNELNSSVCDLVQEMKDSWSQEVEDYRIENLIMEDIHQCIFLETVKVVQDLIKEHESRIKDQSSVGNFHKEVEIVTGKESLIQKLDFLLSDVEIEEILMQSSETKKESSYLDYFSSEIEEMKNQNTYNGISDEDETNFCEVQSKLERALHQLGTTKALLREFADDEDMTASKNSSEVVHDQMKLHDLQSPNEARSCSLSPEGTEVLEDDMLQSELLDSNHISYQEISTDDRNDYLQIEVEDHMNSELGHENEEQPQALSAKEMEEFQVNQLDSELVSSLVVLSQVIVNVEGILQEKLDISNLRLQKVNDEVRPLLGHISSLKKNESLYKEAFIIRCQNLLKAESEVDVLGDQVDALTSLLERIYSTLHYYSPVLQHFTGVMDILMWIKKELNIM